MESGDPVLIQPPLSFISGIRVNQYPELFPLVAIFGFASSSDWGIGYNRFFGAVNLNRVGS